MAKAATASEPVAPSGDVAAQAGPDPDQAPAAPTPPEARRPEPSPAEVLGHVAWLATLSPAHRHLFLSDLEWLVMPPIRLRQFRLFYGEGRPVGFATWAMVTPEVEERLRAGHPKLKPDEWTGGERAWLIDLIAPFGNAEGLVKSLKEQAFQDRDLMVVRRGAEGQGLVAQPA